MEAWEVAARESIRDLVARYNANGDVGRFDAVMALFAEDAVMELPLATHRGHAEIRRVFEGVSGRDGSEGAPVQYMRHFTATHTIDFEGESEASGRCYYAVITERGLDHWGRYVDRYRRVDERWLFQHRRVTVDGCAPGSFAEPHLQAKRR